MVGAPMKPATKAVAGPSYILGRADLLDAAVPEHDDPVGERHRLDLIVGHVDDRGRYPCVQLLDLGANLDPQLGIEVRERLVEQENLGLRTIARPIATRWRWPPDSCRGPPMQLARVRGSLAASRTRRAISLAGMLR